MNQYFLVLDSKNRLVFKKKLEKDENQEALLAEYRTLDFVCHFLEGKTFNQALLRNGLALSKESAFYIKRDLKEHLYFTDKWIKEFLGEPDRIEKVKNSSDQLMQMYSKTRVEAVLADPRFQVHAAAVKGGREKRTQDLDRQTAPDQFRRSPYVPVSKTHKTQKDRLKELASTLRKDWDLNEYKEFFPLARELKRKHLFFVGPTNSGKSYRGFNELANAESGAYLAPLRLLALEGQEEIEKRGKECSLLTGEEMELRPESSFVASTIEMANLDKAIDCALIDEVQLVLDRNRGWAWCQALVGIPARQVIMTGSEECIPTLERLIRNYLGEELEVVRLNRIGKLEVLSKPVSNLKQVEAGTAIVTFSRRGVLSLKKELEDHGRKVSVLYGNLSPGVRREEARRFRSGETDLLVATDCIGMGLNLPIKTVLFSETSKFDGKEERLLNTQEIKQIAGRAGRYGKFEVGHAGVLNGASPKLVSQSLHKNVSLVLESCCVRPTESQLELLREQIGGDNIRSALMLFTQLSKNNSIIVCSDLEEMLGIAGKLEEVESLSKLPFSDKYLFTCGPASSKEEIMNVYIQWLISYAKRSPVLLQESDYREYLEKKSTNEDRVLNAAENSVKVLTLYHWLARKKPEHFPSFESCEEFRNQINTFIENSLKARGLHKQCSQCSKKLPMHYTYKMCENCFRSGRRGRSPS